MSQGTPTPAHETQNGHSREALDHRAITPAQAHADAEELLSRAHMHAELLRVHAEAARAEALSLRTEAVALRRAAREEAAAASAHAEALTAHVQLAAEEFRSAMEGQADAARTEIERLRTEAASLRRLLQAETNASLADTQRMRAEIQALWADTDKLAAELRLLAAGAGAGAGGEAAREQLGTQTFGLEGAGRLAHEPAATGYAHVIGQQQGAGSAAGDSPRDGRLDQLRMAIATEVEQRLANLYAGARDRPATPNANPGPIGVENGREAMSAGAEEWATTGVSPPSPPFTQVDTRRSPDPVIPQLDVRELLTEIWNAAYTESVRLSNRGFPDEAARTPDKSADSARPAPSPNHAVGRRQEGPQASEPLIGSGGWRASTASTSAAAPVDDPVEGVPTPPPLPARRHGRTFRRWE